MEGNKIQAFEPTWIEIQPIVESEIHQQAQTLVSSRSEQIKEETRASWVIKAITCTDLTTLAGDDTEVNVAKLCQRAINPLRSEVASKLDLPSPFTCGAVCVYPARVPDAVQALKNSQTSLPIASVAAGFPAGQTFLNVKLLEIKEAVAAGAREIDIVISRRHAILHDWQALYDELKAMKEACGDAHLKTILAVGELPSFTEVYQASMIAMMAGSDFIKTSTGKETTNATLPVGLVMARAIKDYHAETGIKVGLKPAGGIRTSDDALNWLMLVKQELGEAWMNPHLFRIGASGLLTDMEKELYKHVNNGQEPPS